MPEPPGKKAKDVVKTPSETNMDAPSGELPEIPESAEAELATDTSARALDTAPGDSTEQASSSVPKMPWPDLFTTRLAPFLSAEKIEEIKRMFLEGRNPPFVSDAGWAGRQGAKTSESGVPTVEEGVESTTGDERKKGSSKRGRDRGGRGGLGGRGGRGGRGGKPVREDHRKVRSEVRAPSIP